MNKKIQAYFEGKNFTISGNTAYGNLNGYEANVFVQTLDNVAPVKLHLAFYATPEVKQQIVNEIRDLKIKMLRYSFDSYGLTLGMNDLTVGKLMTRMDAILAQVFEVLSRNGALGIGYCPLCGEAIDLATSKRYQVDLGYITLDEKCVENVNAVINEENKDFNNAPNNYVKGTLGALLGALIGIVSFIILYFIGYISAISAFLATFLGAIFYQKFGGKPNKMMIIIVTVVSIVSMLLAVFLIYAIAAKGIAYEAGYNMSMIEAFVKLMDDPAFSKEFVSNLGMTAFFSILGSVSQISILNKKTKRQETIK